MHGREAMPSSSCWTSGSRRRFPTTLPTSRRLSANPARSPSTRCACPHVKLGDAALVLGAGPIGLLCLQTARAAGATTVIVSEPAPGRAEAARRLGADAVLNPADGDFAEQVVELTGGAGPQVVFECAAAPSTLEQGLDLCARGGQVVMIAIAWEPTPVVPPNWMAREVRMQSSFGTLPEDWRIALDLMRTGRVSVEHMLTGTNFVPLEGIQGAFESLCHPTSELQMVVKL